MARYDRWRHRAEAEVAFFVDDANHGRGLATVLLEHLAARGPRGGAHRVHRVCAAREPQDDRGVHARRGSRRPPSFADGVVEVRLGLQPTPEAEAAIEERARRAAAEAVRRLLSPRSVAVIGASREPGSIGHEVLRNLQRVAFAGPVWPVNPNADHVGSVRAVASILDITDEVDLAVVAVPAARVAEVVEECGRKQVYGVVVLSAGFAERDDEGAALEAEVLRVARSWGVRLVGPNCLGIINTDPDVRLHATFAPVVTKRGPVSLLSESGMVGAAIIAQARELGVGISSFVALGNRADVSGNDLLQYWDGDPTTEVVCMYIESLGNPRHFSRVARRLARVKPVVAVKAGRLPTTASTVGTDATEDALLRQTGVIRVPTLAALDTTRLLISQPLPAGRRVGGGRERRAARSPSPPTRCSRPACSSPSSRRPPRWRSPGWRATPWRRWASSTWGSPPRRPTSTRPSRRWPPTQGWTRCSRSTRRRSARPAAEASAGLAAAHQAQPDVPLVACFYGEDRRSAEGTVPVYDALDAAARALRARRRLRRVAGPSRGRPAGARRRHRRPGALRWCRTSWAPSRSRWPSPPPWPCWTRSGW